MPRFCSLSSDSKLLPWALALLVGTAAAQSPDEPGKPSLPTQLNYTSPLAAYQAYANQPVEPWREANDRVGRIGGWRSYAKEIQTGEPAKDTPAASDPHTGHHGESKP